ncbi:MAG: hypothetical protein GXO87_06640 [Chlorobi bacterium]|nr:hypothetical protein [Chlorobiota bacterium]
MNPNEFMLESALSFERDEKFLHALQIYRRLLSDENLRKKAALRVAVVYDKLNKSKEATIFLADYCSENPEDIEIVKYLASRFIYDRQYQNAVDLLNLQDGNENPEISFLRGYADYYLGEFETAKKNLTEFVQSGSRGDLLFDAFLHLAKSDLNLGLIDEAFEAVEKAEKFDSENGDALFVKAKIFYIWQMYRHAYEAIKKAQLADEGNPKYLKLLAKVLFKIGDYQKAGNYLMNLCSMNCGDEEIFALLGFVRLKENDKAGAEKHFKAALAFNSDYDYAKEGLKRCK